MATLSFVQTDTAGDFSFGEFCASAPDGVGEATINRQAVDGGTAGTSAVTIQVNKGDTQTVINLTFHPNTTTYAAGDWSVPVNVTSANTTLEFKSVYLCRVNSSGVNQETIASITGLTTQLSGAVHTFNFTGVGEITAAAGDRVVFVGIVGMDVGVHADQTAQITPNQTITTPIVATTTVNADQVIAAN